MTEHVVVGAGPVGTAVARRLAGEGAAVSLLSRSGRGPELPGVRRGTVDARDGAALTAAARGAEVLYLCVNPPRYDQWAEQWPPMTAGFLAAAEATGAVLAMVGNLYPYGPVDGPIREGMPDRAPGAEGEAARRPHRRGAGPARGRPDPYGRGARVGLRRRGRRQPPGPGAAPGAVRPAGADDRRGRPAALLDLRRGRRPHDGRRGRLAGGLGPGLARADQPAAQPARRRARPLPGRGRGPGAGPHGAAPGAAGRRRWSSRTWPGWRRPATSSSGRTCSTPRPARPRSACGRPRGTRSAGPTSPAYGPGRPPTGVDSRGGRGGRVR